jgi:phosphatidate phosphatase APP1
MMNTTNLKHKMHLSKPDYKKKVFRLKKIRLWIKQKLGWLGKPIIIPYTGYGNQEKIYFIGCVSEDKALEKPHSGNTKWQNLIAMIRRFTAEVQPGVKVSAFFHGIEETAETDEYGIFRFAISIKDRSITFPENNWLDIQLEFVGPTYNTDKYLVTGKVLLVNPDKISFGIISDVDDTVLVSHSTNFIRKFRLMLFKNAYTRLPFEGVAGFYRALNRGFNGNQYNPIFYVSNSQWNLFDLLTDFCNFRNIPEGVMLLQELRPFHPRKLIKKKRAIGRHPHKVDKIRSILSTYDSLKFVLIGDSGQKDAEVYQQIAQEFPGRILAIYIRDVRKSREKRVLWMSNDLRLENVEMLMIRNTEYAARHAAKIGLINPNLLSDIFNEQLKDQEAKITI